MKTRNIILGVLALALIAGLANTLTTRNSWTAPQKQRTVQPFVFQDGREFVLLITEGEAWKTDPAGGNTILRDAVSYHYDNAWLKVTWVDETRTDSLDWAGILKDQVSRMEQAGYTVIQLPNQTCFRQTVPGKSESPQCGPL